MDVILQSFAGLLKHDHVDIVTTNRVAEVAGVSIGSLYQYFPNKHAMLVALHERHVAQMERRIDGVVTTNAGASIESLVRALMDELVDAHVAAVEVCASMEREVAHGSEGTDSAHVRLREGLGSALGVCVPRHRAEPMAFTAAHAIGALAHRAVLSRPSCISLKAAKEESVKAVVAYLRG